MPKNNIQKNNITCDEKIYCYKHVKCNKQCETMKIERLKVIIYVLSLINLYKNKLDKINDNESIRICIRK